MSWRWSLPAVGWLFLAAAFVDVPIFAALPLAYVCLWLGVMLPLQRVGRTNDISYGVYIYAFPVQQLLVLYGATVLGVWGFIGLATVITIPFAVASWLIVEKPAMSLKSMTLRRRTFGLPPRRATAEQITPPGQAAALETLAPRG